MPGDETPPTLDPMSPLASRHRARDNDSARCHQGGRGERPADMTDGSKSWIVFRVAAPDAGGGRTTFGVCERGEWKALDQLRPGHLALVRAGFPTEAAAEQFARAG